MREPAAAYGTRMWTAAVRPSCLAFGILVLLRMLLEEFGPREHLATDRALIRRIRATQARPVAEPHVLVEALLVAIRSTAHQTHTVSTMGQLVATKVVASREADTTDVALERLAVTGLAGKNVLL